MSDEKEPPWLLILTNLERTRQDVADLSQKIGQIEASSKHCADAFPGGDAEGHRRFHESLIRQMESRNQMFRGAVQYVLNAVALAVVVGVGVAIWNYTSVKLIASATSAGSPSHVTKGAANETDR